MADDPSPEQWAEVGRVLAAVIELENGLRIHMAMGGDPAQSLRMVAEFFSTTGHTDIAQYIGRIALAFYDRAEGINDPIFNRQDERKTDATQKWRGRSWAALGFECLIRAKMKQPKATEYACRKHPELRRLMRGKRNLTESLKGWHVAFMTRVKKPPPADVLKSFGNVYRKLRLDETLADAEYLSRADFCFSKAAEIARDFPD